MMRFLLGLLCAGLLLNAQIDWEIPEPLDVEPLTDEEAAAIIVDMPVVEPVRVEMPVVDVPVVDLPAVLAANIPGVSVATVDLICWEVRRMGVRTIDVVTVSIVARAIEMIGVEGMKVTTPAAASSEAVRVVLAALEAVDCKVVSPAIVAVALQQVSAGRILAKSVDVPGVTLADSRIPAIQEFWRKCQAVFADQRMMQHDKGLDFENPAMQKWLEIYEQPLPPAIEHVPLQSGIRMIAELRMLGAGQFPPAAEANLAIYAQKGYNACLITIYGYETAHELLTLASMIRAAGMSPWFAWSGPESLTTTIFHDPDLVARLLSPLARVADGYLCAWRRTSAHLVQQDPQYIEHLTATVRKANPRIPVVGESYYGQTWENEPHVNQAGWQARDNSPRNPSGVLIAGVATRGYSIEYLLDNIFARWQDTPRLGMVLGERPYYASRADTGRSWHNNMVIKQELEERFMNAGCVGTITLHGDGSDRGLTFQSTDNIGLYPIEQ